MTLWHQSGRTVPGRRDHEWSRLVTPPRFAAHPAPAPVTERAPGPAPERERFSPPPPPDPAPAPAPPAAPTPTAPAPSAVPAALVPSVVRPREGS
ncbi:MULTISPECIES: hypothetical protein [Kitasatospora]|uniref:hypothetical protein n=1 Tax=Kitasatospora TaxID=2063 RepID=UPI0002F46D4E|nr:MULTISPECIES: hypothetical protein [Kitasatospora]